MTYLHEVSARSIVHSLQLMEIQAAESEYDKKHDIKRDKGGRFAEKDSGGSILDKAKELADSAKKSAQDVKQGIKEGYTESETPNANAANKQGRKLGRVALDAKTEFDAGKAAVAKQVDAIYADATRRKAEFDKIGPNVSGAIDAIGKNFNNKSKEVNNNVHKMMDRVGKGIRGNAMNVSETIGKEMTAASLYLTKMSDDFGQGGTEGYTGKISPRKGAAVELGRSFGQFVREKGINPADIEDTIKPVTRGIVDTKKKIEKLPKELPAAIGRAATGLAAFMSPEHLAEVGKNMSKAAMDGAKQTPAKVKAMLDDMAKKAKEGIEKGTSAIKDFGAGAGEGVLEGVNERFNPGDRVAKHEDDNAAKGLGRKVGKAVGGHSMTAGGVVGATAQVAFGTALPEIAIPVAVGIAIGDDLSHPNSQIKKHVGDAYNAAKSKLASMRDKPEAQKPLSSKEKEETKDKLDKSTAELAVATMAKDEKKIGVYKSEIVEGVAKLRDAQLTHDKAINELRVKTIDPIVKQAKNAVEENPATTALSIGFGLATLLGGPEIAPYAVAGIAEGQIIDNASKKAKAAKQEKAKVQAATSPQLLMASCVGVSARLIASRL